MLKPTSTKAQASGLGFAVSEGGLELHLYAYHLALWTTDSCWSDSVSAAS